MAININASTSAGFEVTPDNSGNLNIQSGGSTKLAITSAGAAVTGTFTVNGAPAGDYNGFKNRIINGDMRIDQRNNGATINPSSYQYGLDRWFFSGAQGGNSYYTMGRSTQAPTGFTNSLCVTSTTSSNPDGLWYFRQHIEGYNVADLAYGTASAQPVTVSFWVKSSIVGLYGISLHARSASSTYNSYSAQYTISSANTWEQKTITIPGNTALSIATDNTEAFKLYFHFGNSSLTTTLNTWVTNGDIHNFSGNAAFLGTNGATLYITGVQLEKGSTATSFDVRDYTRELAMCQRYYSTFMVGFDYKSPASGYTLVGTQITFSTTMRASPTLTKGSSPIQSNVGTLYFPAENSLNTTFGTCLQMDSSAYSVRTYYFNTISASAEL